MDWRQRRNTSRPHRHNCGKDEPMPNALWGPPSGLCRSHHKSPRGVTKALRFPWCQQQNLCELGTVKRWCRFGVQARHPLNRVPPQLHWRRHGPRGSWLLPRVRVRPHQARAGRSRSHFRRAHAPTQRRHKVEVPPVSPPSAGHSCRPQFLLQRMQSGMPQWIGGGRKGGCGAKPG